MSLKQLLARTVDRSDFPECGRRIEITWLPKNNAYPEDNAYIGSAGVVSASFIDGSFDLKYDSGATLIVSGSKDYRYRYID